MGPFNDLSYQNYVPYSVSPPTSSSSWDPTPAIAGMVPYIGPVLQAIANGIISNNQQSRMNRYNSPVNQMARLRAAGINPYSAFGQIAAQNQSASQNPVNVHLDNLFDNVSKYLQLEGVQEDVRGKKIQNDILDTQNRFQRETYRSRFQQQLYSEVATKLHNDLTRGRITYQQYANHMKKLDDDFLNEYTNGYLHFGETPNEVDDYLQGITYSKDADISNYSFRFINQVLIPMRKQLQYMLQYEKLMPEERKIIQKRLDQYDKLIESARLQNKHNKWLQEHYDTDYMFYRGQVFDYLHEAEAAASTVYPFTKPKFVPRYK